MRCGCFECRPGALVDMVRQVPWAPPPQGDAGRTPIGLARRLPRPCLARPNHRPAAGPEHPVRSFTGITASPHNRRHHDLTYTDILVGEPVFVKRHNE
jgi:hypothetical protein